jgi:DUF1365 family protein
MVNETSSAIYECEVMHHRLTPLEHHFKYRVFYLWLDLDELDALDDHLRLFSRNHFNLFSFFDADHLEMGKDTAKENLLEWVRQQGMSTDGIRKVRLLAFPRVVGYGFNPVCFFYCFDADERPVCAVTQVTNTFLEQKPYLLREKDESGRFRLVTPKHFYVSPFSALDLSFDFKIPVPGERLEIHIDDREGGRRVLLSSLTGKRRPLTDGRLLWYLVKYPLLTLRVIFLIHWHALLLWIRRMPVHRKAAEAHLQRGVLKPHRSTATQTTPP